MVDGPPVEQTGDRVRYGYEAVGVRGEVVVATAGDLLDDPGHAPALRSRDPPPFLAGVDQRVPGQCGGSVRPKDIGPGGMVHILQLPEIRDATAGLRPDPAGREPAGNPQVLILRLEGDIAVHQPEEGLALEFRNPLGEFLELQRGHLADASASKRESVPGQGPSDALDGVDELDLVLVELVLVDGRRCTISAAQRLVDGADGIYDLSLVRPRIPEHTPCSLHRKVEV